MKKLILCSLIFAGINFYANSQNIANNAIGLRLGGGNGFGTEVSYQHGLGDNNRLEVDLGWRSGNDFDGFKLIGLYQWIWVLEGDFNWYAGVGGGLGSFDNDRNNSRNETFAVAAGNIGIEYIFDIPLMISLDFRPELGFGSFNDDLDFDIALGIRYRF